MDKQVSLCVPSLLLSVLLPLLSVTSASPLVPDAPIETAWSTGEVQTFDCSSGSSEETSDPTWQPLVDEESPRRRRQVDGDNCSRAVDEVIAFHAGHLRDNPRVIELPDMRRESSQHMLFLTITTVMEVTDVRLRLPDTIWRVSSIEITRNDEDVAFEFDVALGHMNTWGDYDVKVGGVGPSGDYTADIDDRVVRATVRYQELPASDNSTGRCRLHTRRLTLSNRGRYRVADMPPVFASWGADVEDVPATLEIMRDMLNTELANYPCDERFAGLVRSCLEEVDSGKATSDFSTAPNATLTGNVTEDNSDVTTAPSNETVAT